MTEPTKTVGLWFLEIPAEETEHRITCKVHQNYEGNTSYKRIKNIFIDVETGKMLQEVTCYNQFQFKE